MVRARKERGWTQEELGRKVGTSQNVISLIESGGVGASTFVTPICEKLKIPFPMFFEDDWQKNWHHLGRLLREQDIEGAEAAVKMVEAMLRKNAQPANTDEDRSSSRDKRK